MMKSSVCIFGAGPIGTALAMALARTKTFSVRVVDRSEEALDRLSALNTGAALHVLNHRDELQTVLVGQDVAVAAVPDAAIDGIARAAVRAGVHYLDFAGRQRTREILEPLAQRRTVFSGCGVSPGIIENVAWGLLKSFASATDLTIRVGAIPRYPTNRLGYGQIWNVDGLINEYTQPSAAVRDGETVWISPLEEHGQININGVTYEEFITSGGVEDLSKFSQASPKNLTFKTIRYPGHLEYIRFLLDDLGLRRRPDMLKSLLYNGLPLIEDDVLLLVVTARGMRGRQPVERTICHRFSPHHAVGPFNALTSVAAGYAAVLLSMLHRGEIAPSGFVEHHCFNTKALLEETFLAPLISR